MEGATYFRLLTETWRGGVPHKICLIYPLPPFDWNCPAFDREQYPRMTNYGASQDSKPDCTSPPNDPIRPRVEHPVIASSWDRLSPKLRNFGEQVAN